MGIHWFVMISRLFRDDGKISCVEHLASQLFNLERCSVLVSLKHSSALSYCRRRGQACWLCKSQGGLAEGTGKSFTEHEGWGRVIVPLTRKLFVGKMYDIKAHLFAGTRRGYRKSQP